MVTARGALSICVRQRPSLSATVVSVDPDSLQRGLHQIEVDLDLSSGFLITLWAEKSAWSFIIKGQALIETALSQLLASYLLDRRLDQAVQYLPMGGKAGKIAFLRATGLLDPEEETFLNELGALRNHLVHSVHNTCFDFPTFVATGGKHVSRLAKAAAAFGESGEVRKRYETDFRKNPQHLLWLAVLFVVAKLSTALERSKTKRRALERRIRRLYET